MKGNDRADRLAFRKIIIVEELETLREGTKPRISHRRWPAGERRGKRKRWVILPEQERRQQLHRETDGSSETDDKRPGWRQWERTDCGSSQAADTTLS